MRKKVVARYTAKSHSKKLASARYQRYKEDPNSTYKQPRVFGKDSNGKRKPIGEFPGIKKHC